MGDLTRAFRELVPGGEALDDAALEHALEAALAAGRAAWPRVSVPDEEAARFLAERVSADEDPVGALGERCVDDLYLACGCLRGDPAAIAGFEQSCLSAVPAAVRRIVSDAALVDEVCQLARVSLLVGDEGRPKKLASYRGTGKLRSWVQVAAVRLALDNLRRRRRDQPADDDRLLEASELDDDPELVHIKQLYRSEFKDAFRGAMGELTSRERNLLRMYLVDGLGIDQIGPVYGVHRATAARWIASSREKLLHGTRERLVEALRLSDHQFESLMRVVRSNLDLSVERLLGNRSRGS